MSRGWGGHLAWLPLPGDGQVSLRFGGDFAAQYDQAGLMLRVDEETWVKAGIERADGRDWLSVVVTAACPTGRASRLRRLIPRASGS